MDTFADRQRRFRDAGADLRERLISGARNLREMAETSSVGEKNRRLDKAGGLDFAIEVWDDLSTGPLTDKGDYAGVWRTFTDLVSARLGRDGFEPGYYQGVHLALTYQRGYGDDIDAPVFINPHA